MPRRRTKHRPALGAVSVNNAPTAGADVGVTSVGKQSSSSGVSSSVEKKSKFPTTTSASIEENDLTFVTADDFIDEAALFAEEVEEEDEDFDPIKDATIQKDDLNLRVADGFIDEAILFAEEKDNEADEDDDTDDEDFDPVKDATIQKDDLNLKASDGFIDEAILHAEEKEKVGDDKSAKIIPSPSAEEKQNAVSTQTTPPREVLLNRIESIVMLATIEHGGILLKDIAPLYFQEVGEAIPVKKCFGPSQNLRKVLAKWSPCVSIDTDGRASWTKKKSEPASIQGKPTEDPEDDDEDYDPAGDSSVTSVDLDLHNPDGFFDASVKALKKEVKALADDSVPKVPRDVLLNRIKCIVEEATAASPTGINMASIVPAYKTKYGDNLSAKQSFGIKLKDILIQFFPEVEIIGNNAIWRAAASTAIAKETVEKEPAFSNVKNSMEEEKATGVVVEGMPSSAEDLAEVKGALEELVENPYSEHEEDEEPEPICAMCIVM